MEIKRDSYLRQLNDSKNNGVVKVITGMAQCGKSYLLNKLFYESLLEKGVDREHIIRISLDSEADLKLIGEKPRRIISGRKKVDSHKFLTYVNALTEREGQYYLLIDEIQLLENCELVLNGLLRKYNLDIYVTGQGLKFLYENAGTEFAGRAIEMHLYPLGFSEFMQVYQGDKYQGLDEYMKHGGLPPVVLAENEEKKRAKLANLVEEKLIPDIVKGNRIRRPEEIKELLKLLSESICNLVNPDKLCNEFHEANKSNITSNTIRKFIRYLEDSFIVCEARRYNIRKRRYLDSNKKYYFEDIGIRNTVMAFNECQEPILMENLIYNELVSRGFNVDVGIVPVSIRGEEGKPVRKQLEVDFVCNKGYDRVYIQSAFAMPSEKKRNQEVRPFCKINDSFSKVIVTKDMVPMFKDENGILTINIFDFLLNPDLI